MSMLFSVLSLALSIYQLIMLARVLMSWFPNVDRTNPLIRLVFELTEPVLAPIRNLMPRTMMVDFSPLIVFLIIAVLQRVLLNLR